MLSSVTPRLYEFGDHLGLAGRFAAYAYRYARRLRGLAGLPDQGQNGGMVGVLEPSQPLVAPVRGEGVLDEVVRAYGEEGRLLGELRRAERGRRGLDHHARLDLPDLYPFLFELPTSTPCSIFFAACNSPTSATMGNMTLRLPWAAARRIARSWGLKRSGVSRLILMPRQPRKGLSSSGLVHAGKVLVPSHVERADDDGLLAERAGYGACTPRTARLRRAGRHAP